MRTKDEITPIRLNPENQKSVWQSMANAYFNYPSVEYFFPDLRLRKKVLAWYLGYPIRYSLKRGVVYTTPDHKSVAAWLTPKETYHTVAGHMGAGFLKCPFLMGPAAFRRLLDNDMFLEKIRKEKLPGPHWYLWELGVDPAVQKQGVATALLEPTLLQADQDNLPAFLETHLATNVPFYQKLGFEIVFEGKVPKHDITVWSMLRPPRS